MKDSTLEVLAPLLSVLRSFLALEEVRPTAFHLDGRDFIHFHEEPPGLFADVRLSKGRVRMSVVTRSEQGELLERIEEKLVATERRERGKRQRKRGAHGHDS